MNAKRIFPLLMILSLAIMPLLAACAPAVQSTDPITVVKSFYEIINTKDVEKAMSLTAEDYVMNDPFGTYDRAGAAVQWQTVVAAGLSFNQTNFVDTGNGRVISCYEVFANGKSIDKGCGNVTYVRDGKIIFDGLEPAEQIWIVQEYYEAVNAGDVEAAMSFVAEDVKCRGGCYLTGKEAFRSYVQGGIDLARGGRVELSDLQVEGDKVTYYWKAYNKDGNLSASGVEVLQIKDGLIILMETNL